MIYDPPLTRKQRHLCNLRLVGVRYTESRIGRNEHVSVDGGPTVKFKRTGVYRAGRK